MNIIIPTLGGNRGFKIPRYLLKVNNQYIIDNLIKQFKFKANLIFIISQRDKVKFKSNKILKSLDPKCKIVIAKKKYQRYFKNNFACKKVY